MKRQKLIKWVGGKFRLAPHLPTPPDFKGRYFEPFFGSGDLYFTKMVGTPATLSDTNPHLMDFWRCVRQDPIQLKMLYEMLVVAYGWSTDPGEFYNRQRDRFNAGVVNPVKAAANFLFLNRAGFNGLWRVNRAGELNTPWGKVSQAQLPSPKLIPAYSQHLRGTVLLTCSFEEAVKNAFAGDFVYFDPPYLLNDATNYTPDGFGPEDHEHLAQVARELSNRGVFVLSTNIHSAKIKALWAGFTVKPILNNWAVGQGVRGVRRTRVVEAIICNY